MRARIVGHCLSVVMLASAALPGPVRALHDHLECYKIKDPLKLRGVVDVDASPVANALGCKLGKARYFCAPASKTVLSSNVGTELVPGRELSDDRICYNLRCPKPPPPDQSVRDQFGQRTVARLAPRLLCTPAVKGPPLDTQDNLDDIACYKVRDPLTLRARVALDSPQFGFDSSCSLKTAKLFCAPAHTTLREINVGPLLDIGGPIPDDQHVCYPLRCRGTPPGAQIVSDRFGSRTMTNFVQKLMCTPAAPGIPTTTTTSTTVQTTTTTSTTFPPGTDPPLVCQRAIESGGLAYANEIIAALADCAGHQNQTITQCMATASVSNRLQDAYDDWLAAAQPPCAAVNLRTQLGYAERCGAAPSLCTSPVSGTQSVVGCLTCRFKETLQSAAVRFYNDQPTNQTYESCSEALGNGSLGVIDDTLQALHACVQQPGLRSVASCFAPTSAVWRPQAESACMTVNPFTQMSYPKTCSGRMPVPPNSYVFTDPPCTINVSVLTDPVPDNDLLDCFACRAEESVLDVARDMYGTNLCCIGGTCNKVLTRFACREAGGTPVRYRLDSLPGFSGNPHGLDIAPNGDLLVADSSSGRILRIDSNNNATLLGTPLGFPVGIAGDAAGNVYVVNRCSQTVIKIAPGGATSVFAGTGTIGHSGDGGPATSAQIVAPDGLQVDPAGNVYFTESGFLNYVCGSLSGAGEYVRMVDTNGIIHTLAGIGPYGSTGEDGPATSAQLAIPYGLRLASNGDVLVGEAGAQRVLRIAGGILTRVTGRPLSPQGAFSGWGGPTRNARFYQNCGVAEDADGNIVVAPMENNRIALVDTLGSVINIAGTGEASSGASGDGGPALFGTVGLPEDIVVGHDGKIYVTDLLVNRIRVLTREAY
jgi:hypothetical protein